MTEPLKPVSDAMRAALVKLGHTAEDLQKAKAPKRDHKLPPDPKLTPAAIIAARWTSERWRPDARVMFLRRAICLRCGTEEMLQHWPETFIRESLLKEPGTIRYLPSRSSLASALKLPLITETVEVRQHSCLHCPDWSQLPNHRPEIQPSCLADLLSSSLGSTASSGLKGGQTSTTSAGEPCTLASPSPAGCDTLKEDPDSSRTSTESSGDKETTTQESSSPEPGSSSTSAESAPPVGAAPTIFHTILDVARASGLSLIEFGKQIGEANAHV